MQRRVRRACVPDEAAAEVNWVQVIQRSGRFSEHAVWHGVWIQQHAWNEKKTNLPDQKPVAVNQQVSTGWAGACVSQDK